MAGRSVWAAFTFDEAESAGASHVVFSQPVIHYLENFLGYPVGAAVPVGELDVATSNWIGKQDGRVVQILSVTNGMADLDVDGSGQAASAATCSLLGISDDERTQLASLYAVGQTLWRVAATELCSEDWNALLTPNGDPTGTGADGNPPVPNPCELGGSIIDCENQGLGESVPVTGTPFTLSYESARQKGFVAGRQLTVQLSGATIPPEITKIHLLVKVAGQQFIEDFSPAPNLSTVFRWNGLDAYGRTVQGTAVAHVTIVWDYPPQLVLGPASDANSFAVAPSGSTVYVIERNEDDVFHQPSVSYDVPLRGFDAKGFGLAGLTLSAQHVYDAAGAGLLLGDGTDRIADGPVGTVGASATIDHIAGGGGGYADGTSAFSQNVIPSDIGVFPNGDSVWPQRDTVWRLGSDGNVHLVAGTPFASGFSGDGGPATQALLSGANTIAVCPDSGLYVGDRENARIRRVAPDGTISTYAGTGVQGDTGDGGPALAAEIDVGHLACGPDGSLYFTDPDAWVVRRILPSGTIMRFAGDGGFTPLVDEVPATQSHLYNPQGISVGEHGDVFVVDYGHRVIHRVDLEGTIHLALGGYLGDKPRCSGCDATQSGAANVFFVAAMRGGGFVEFEQANGGEDPQPANRIREVLPNGKVYDLAGSRSFVGDFAQDGIAALQADVGSFPNGIAVDPAGRLLLAESSEYAPGLYVVQPGLPGFSLLGSQVAAADGSELYVFDAQGRHVKTLDTLTGATIYSFAYAGGRLTSVTDRAGNGTTIERDGAGNPTAIVAPGGQRTVIGIDANGYVSTIADPGGNTVHFTLDSTGLLTDFHDANGGDHPISYDALGRLTKDSNPAGGYTQLTRSETGTGFTVTESSALSRTTTFALAAIDDKTGQETVTRPDGSQSVAVTAADRTRTETAADGTQTVTKLASDPRFGQSAPVVADFKLTTPAGLTLETTDSRNVTLSNPHDVMSVVTETDTVTVNGKSFTSAFDRSTKTIATTTPAGRQRILTLDALGRVVQAQTGSLAPVAIAYDIQGRVQTVTQGTGSAQRQYQFGYDTSNRLQSVTDPLSRAVSFGYDLADRVNLQTLPDTKTVAATYDANSNLTSLTPPGKPAHAFGYTPVDLESSYTPPDVTGDGSRSTSYSFNVDRQLTQVSRPDALTVTPTYDATKGRITSLAWSAGSESFSYDSNNGKLNAVTAPGGISLAFGYDGPLPTSETWSGAVAGSVTRTFDDNLRLTSESVNGANSAAYGYDDDGLVTSVAAGGITESITRSADTGQITATSAGSVTTTRTYNAFGEPAEDQAKFGSTLLYDAIYDDGVANPRDKLGRIQKKTETIDGVTHSYAYTYDLRGRLTAVTIDGASSPARSWTYDDNGNRLTQTSGEVTTYYLYDSQDRLLCERASSGGDCVGATVSYTWTANGELAAKTDAVGTTSYQYDELGNLRHVDLPGGHTIDYLIDGANRRVGRKYDGALTNAWVYRNSLKPVAELDGSGNVVARFVYATKGQVPDLIVKGGATYRVVSDHLGTPRIVVDQASGSVVERLDVDEWGNVTSDTNSGWQPFGFDGGLADAATGLVRFGARDLDPRSGRWTSREPLGVRRSLNVYAFAANEPVNHADPNGLDVVAYGGAAEAALEAVAQDPAFGPLLNRINDDPNVLVRIALDCDIQDYGYTDWTGSNNGDPQTFDIFLNPCAIQKAQNQPPLLSSDLAHELGHVSAALSLFGDLDQAAVDQDPSLNRLNEDTAYDAQDQYLNFLGLGPVHPRIYPAVPQPFIHTTP